MIAFHPVAMLNTFFSARSTPPAPSFAQIAAEDVQRPPEVLARCLRRERLPDAGRAKKVDDEAPALALHEVAEARVSVVRLDERLQEVIVDARGDEVREGRGGPLDGVDVLDVEFYCSMDCEI